MRKVGVVAIVTLLSGVALAVSSCSTTSSTASREGSGPTGGATTAVTTGTQGDTCMTDTQTDPHNCGVCGHDCLGGACASGQCQPFQIASGLVVRGIALDHDYIYAAIGGADNDPGCAALPQIVKFSRTDYTMTPVAPCYQGARSPLVGFYLVGSYIFWEVNGDIMRSRTDGTETIDLGVAPGGFYAVDDQYVYFIDFGDAAHPRGVLNRMDADGQNRVVLSSDPPAIGGLAVDGTNVYFRTGPEPMANDEAESDIAAMPRSGGDVTYIAHDLLAVDALTMVQWDGYVYWFSVPEDVEDSIDRVSTAGGQRDVLSPGDVVNFAFNSQYVFYGQGEGAPDTSTAGVWRIPLSGGSVAAQVPGFTDIVTVVGADDTALVWESWGTPNIGSYTFGFYLLAL